MYYSNNYLIVVDFRYPENMTRQQAFIRRADMLLSWVQKGNFDYIDSNSIIILYKFIDTLTDIIQNALPGNAGREFTDRLSEIESTLRKAKAETDIIPIYEAAIENIASVLHAYKAHLIVAA